MVKEHTSKKEENKELTSQGNKEEKMTSSEMQDKKIISVDTELVKDKAQEIKNNLTQKIDKENIKKSIKTITWQKNKELIVGIISFVIGIILFFNEKGKIQTAMNSSNLNMDTARYMYDNIKSIVNGEGIKSVFPLAVGIFLICAGILLITGGFISHIINYNEGGLMYKLIGVIILFIAANKFENYYSKISNLVLDNPNSGSLIIFILGFIVYGFGIYQNYKLSKSK